MAIYKAKNGNKYSEDTVMSAADKAGISLDEFVSNKGLEKIEEEEDSTDINPAKINDIEINDTQENGTETIDVAETIIEPPKKKKKPVPTPKVVSTKDPFGEIKPYDPLGLNKLRNAPATKKPVKTTKPVQNLQSISEYQKRLKEEEDNSFSNYLKESFDAGVSTVVESIYRAPEFVYDIAASITNPVANFIGKQLDIETEDASSEKIMKTFGINNVPADILAKRIKESNTIIKNYSAKNGGDPLTAIENGNYLGAAKMVAGGTTQSVPMIAAAILSGGSTEALAGISASTAISKAQQIKIENPEMDVQTRTTNAAVSGLLEGFLGNLFTGASGAVIKKIVIDKGVKEGSKIVSNGLMSTIEKAIEKNPMIGVLGEMAEESSVELGNQLNDINSGIRKDLDQRSIINAGIIATGMAGTNTVPIYAAKGYMKAKDYNQVKAVNKEINNLSAQLSNPYINDSDKQIISSRVARLVDENKVIVGTNLEKIDALPNNIKSEIVTINTDLDDLKSKYLDIIDNPELPIEVQQAMAKELELQAKGLQNRKSSIIEGNYIYEDFKKLPQAEQDRIKVVANETLVADAELNDDPKTSFNDDEINREAINIYNAELRQKDIVTDVERTKAASKAIGFSEEIDMPTLNTANDVVTYLSTNTDLDNNTIEDLADSYGAFIPLSNGKEALIINKEAAAMDQVVTTGQHEFLHKLIYKAVKDNPELQKKIGTDLYNHIENYIGTEEFNNTEFKSRYDTYKTDFEETKLSLENKVIKAKDYFEKGLISQDKYNQVISDADTLTFKAEGKYLEETLPLLSESLTKGDVKYNETFFTKIGDILRRIFQKYGLSKVKFNTGKDVFDFVRDYNKSFEKGQFTKAFKALAKEGTYKGSVAKGNAPVRTTIEAEVKKSQGLSQVETFKNQLKEIQDNESDYDPDDFDQQVANLQGKIKKAIEKEKTTPVVSIKKEVSEEDNVKEIIKSEKGSLSSDRVQQIYNEKGLNGADEIIKLFRPITNKIVDKRRDAPGFDRQLLTDEIETGSGGILDLIRSYKANKEVPLAAYINKQLPLRAIASSKRVLDESFSKDVTEEKGLMAAETVLEVKEKPKYKNALESKVFSPEVLESANKKILSVVRTLKSKINAPVSLNKTVTPLISEIRDEIGKQLDIDVKTAMGGKKDNQLQNWLLDNKQYVLENMTTTWLMGKDGQGGMPIAIQKQIDGKWVSYPNWVGQKIDREKTSTDNAGRTSGAELVRRLPNVANNISDSEFLDQVIGPDGNPLRGRKESLAKAIAEEASFDIINNDFENEGPIFDAFKINQERLGVELIDNVATEISRQIERGNVKFSMSKKEFQQVTSDLFHSASDFGIESKEVESILNKLPLEEREKAKDYVFGDYIDLVAKLQNIKAGVRGTAYEEIILKELKKLKLNGVRVINTKAQGFDSTGSGDINIQLGNDLLNIEVKLNKLAQMGSFSMDFNPNNKTFNPSQKINGLEELSKKLEDKASSFDAYAKGAESLGIDISKWPYKMTKEQHAILKNKGLQKNLTVSVDVNQSVIEQLYNNKGVNYINIGKNGLFSLGADVLNLGVPQLTSDVKLTARLVRGGDYNRIRVFPALIDFNQKSKYNIDNAVSNNALFTRYKENLAIKENQIKVDAIMKSLDIKQSKSPNGISVFDFDDTVGLTKSNVLYTMPDGTKGKLNAEEFAKDGSKLLDEGAEFDFSEFSKVTNGKPGPMVEKMKKMIGKFGPDNFFILTARPADSAGPIHQFLKSIGIDIPLKNITGLGNSTAQSKADWITAKAAEGYNDFYFADDAIQNVTAVKNALEVLDVKSKIQQAKIKFSRTISPEVNKIIEENTGMENYKVFSDIVARRRGVNKNKFDFYVPPSAADFELLLYNFIGKGTRGEEQQKFFADALLKPYANGNDLMDAARQSIKNDYKALINQFPGIKKKIESLTPDGDFTYDQAIRVALWTEEGIEIPGLSQRDQTKLVDLINNDPELTAFKQGVLVTGRQGKGWIAPTEYWDASTIISDLHNLTEGAGRKKFLAEFIENTEEMFGKFENGKLVGPNINKIEAVYGTNVREALDDQLYRMINGKNRSYGSDKETSGWSNWVNGSTGAIMFLNTRSAVLQLLGAVNFLNLRDNNPVAAGIAFANQKQYWADFSRIWNSDKIKERRGGLKEDVAAAEIANAAAGSKNKVNAVISYLLKIGYTPTQLADSFAIASGGAPYYRNRINTYLKEGQSQEDAEKNAWSDFTKVSDETQQSGDPRDISKQQASPAGRLLLTFQNFSMQQSRIVKKSFLDLKNGRGDAKTHVAKIIYYLAVQNILFATLQQGLFAVAFDDDDEELDKEKDKAKKKTLNERLVDVADGVLDTILRGTGFLGGVISVLKNMTKKYLDEKDKGFKADYAKVMLEGANISPPIGSKLRKVYTGLQQTKFEKDLIDERGWGIMQDGRVHLGPMYGVTGKLVEATTNIPMDRLVNKIENVSQAMNSQNKAWQRVAVGLGFTPYSVGIEDTKGDLEIRAKAKATRKEAGKTKRKDSSQQERDSIANLSPDAYMDFVRSRKEARERKKDSIANLPADQKKAYLEKKAIESEARKREKEALKKIKSDSIAGLSPTGKANYDKKVAAEKLQKKKERHDKYEEKKKALQDSLAGLTPKQREKYKADKKAERHQYYIKNKKPSKKKNRIVSSDTFI